MPSSVHLGVDFGTSHTVALLSRADGSTTPLLFDGSPLLPSSVYAPNENELFTGRDAVHSARIDPTRFEPHPKRRVDDGSVLLGDVEIPVPRLFAAVLARVRDECVRVAGTLPPTTLTHPAAWGPARRLVLEDAAAEAGFTSPRLLPEPVAAAGHFMRVADREFPVGSGVVVYDFGGGTLDVSVVVRDDSGLDVAAVDGLQELGGVDLDHALFQHVGGQLGDHPEWRRLVTPESPEDRRHLRSFTEDIRLAKERLSRHNQADIVVPLLDRQLHVTRDELESLTRPLLDQAVRLTKAVMRASRLPAERTAGVFLVGGASRMPLVATLLHQNTGIAPTVIDQPEIVVAHGATLTDPVAATPPAREQWTSEGIGAAPVGTPPSGSPHPVSPYPVSPPPVSASPVSPPAFPPTSPPAPAYGPTGDGFHPAITDPAAMFDLAIAREEQGDSAEAAARYREAADAGHAGAMYNLAILLAEQGDIAEAMTWYRKAADTGDTDAAYNLAILLAEQGDTAEAMTWYRKAADTGHTDAMYNLGIESAEQGNSAEAEGWYRRAVDGGHTASMFNLAVVLSQRGSTAEAEGWYRRAIDGGHAGADAMNNLAILLADRGNSAEAEGWYRRAVDGGHTASMFNLAVVLSQRGSTAEAMTWYRKAADTGDTDAMNNLAILLTEQGDSAEAEGWYRWAVDGGHIGAMSNLAILLTEQGNTTEAETWYRRAADAGDAEAMNNLAILLANRGNPVEAEGWYRPPSTAATPTR
ncbi:tetratricopeptide repeat protein [Stackebrandtia albiflava]|uniref:tetratricopeptide repeat protein n=1 Tax=Stackebrandtia albiflava TaxID=406432 RepID=UPI0031EF052D